MKLMLAGDVMLGRGIDQVLPHPGSVDIFESHVRSAQAYVKLAEARNGPISRPTSFDYVWGDALELLEAAKPECRIVNLETAVTRRGRPEPKGINYRMAPENLSALVAAEVDCCAIANNHVLDWGPDGLSDTLEALDGAGLAHAGAGRDPSEAVAPAVLGLRTGGRVLVFGTAHASAGVPPHWAAGEGRPGVTLLPDLSEASARRIAECVAEYRQPGDVIVISIHWGPNWGYGIREERRFAHSLIDLAGVDIVHGHSSHHPKGIERYRGKLILYGCGDLLNDYEGIEGHEQFRPQLALIYLPEVDRGRTCGLELLAFRIARFRLHAASPAEVQWLANAIQVHSPGLGEHRVTLVESTFGVRGVTGLSVQFGR
jgi:poly-gamma-glutamate synthesis protein (capsule biosynthesis protein)